MMIGPTIVKHSAAGCAHRMMVVPELPYLILVLGHMTCTAGIVRVGDSG
jgi:hypothetical protein